MKQEICKRHNVDHTGTYCGGCFEMYRKRSNKLSKIKKAIKTGKLKLIKKAAK